jgi:hypothetical protein
MTPEERAALIASVTTAYRDRDPFSGLARSHPAWHDLDDQGRREAFEETLASRVLEAALDLNGFSTTVLTVLRRIPGETRRLCEGACALSQVFRLTLFVAGR